MDWCTFAYHLKNWIMKKLAFILSTIIAVGLTSCSQSQEPQNSEESTETKAPVVANAEVNMKIEGMTCVMGCKGAIEKALNNTSGIAKCDVDFENSTAKVTFDNEQISEEEVLAAVHSVNNGAYQASLIEDSQIEETPETESTEA